jgi:hypothetical protein
VSINAPRLEKCASDESLKRWQKKIPPGRDMTKFVCAIVGRWWWWYCFVHPNQTTTRNEVCLTMDFDSRRYLKESGKKSSNQKYIT